MNTDKTLARVGDLVSAIAIEDPVAVARAIAALGLDLVPIDVLRDHLTAEAVARANALADAAERVKFGDQG